MPIHSWFPTQIYFDRLQTSTAAEKKLNQQLLREAYDLQNLDAEGIAWSLDHYPNGFTSYASANRLHLQSTTFEQLERRIDRHVQKFVRALDFDLGNKKLKMNTCWANIMGSNAHHGMHIHPQSVISGTYYVSIPKGASAIKFEDPRLSKFMAAPARRPQCKVKNLNFVSYTPSSGKLVLFESWLRHEVPIHTGKENRVSISFNYDWES